MTCGAADLLNLCLAALAWGQEFLGIRHSGFETQRIEAGRVSNVRVGLARLIR